MKPADWIGLAQLGTSVAGGIAGAGSSQRAAEQAEFDRMRQERADEFNRQLQYYQMQQQARSGLGAFYNQANMDRATGRQALLNASPLGAEQELAYQMARARGLSGVAENFQPAMPTSADIAGLIRPTTNVLGAFTTPDFRQAISPEATARSIAERRKALAGVDPTFQFGSMGDYGLPNLEKEVATYAQGVAADRLSRENLLQDLLLQQTKAAAAFPQTVAQAQGMQGVPPSQTAQAQKPKKNAWWKKVLNVAATAAPIVAAPFTGGTSLALIGAGAGALKGALSGGAKGALTGAAMGAATSAIGGGAAGAAAKRGISEGVKESASAAIKRAILNPRALTQLGGAAIGGQAEQLAQMASPFLPGATAFRPTATPIKPIGLGGVTPPIVGMSVPTPTGAETLGGFRRAAEASQDGATRLFGPGVGTASPLYSPVSGIRAAVAGTAPPAALSPADIQMLLKRIGYPADQPPPVAPRLASASRTSPNGAAPAGRGVANAPSLTPEAIQEILRSAGTIPALPSLEGPTPGSSRIPNPMALSFRESPYSAAQAAAAGASGATAMRLRAQASAAAAAENAKIMKAAAEAGIPIPPFIQQAALQNSQLWPFYLENVGPGTPAIRVGRRPR